MRQVSAMPTALPGMESTAQPTSFEAFWELYPRKVSKKSARAEWTRVNGDVLDVLIINGLRAALTTDEWRRNIAEPGMPHVPHARAWLHNHRWTDVLDELSTVPPPALDGNILGDYTVNGWHADCAKRHQGKCRARGIHILIGDDDWTRDKRVAD